VGGRTLVFVAEILRRGETSLLLGAQNSGEKLKEVQGVMDMLQCGVSVALDIKKNHTKESVKKEGSKKTVENLKISNVTTINSWNEDFPKLQSSPLKPQTTPDKRRGCSPSSSITLSPSPRIKQIKIKEELNLSTGGPDASAGNETGKSSSLNSSNSKSVCPMCDKSVTTAYLKRHAIRFHPETLFTCNICEFKFGKKSNYENHMLRKHKFRGAEGKEVSDTETILCPICDEKFLLKESLKMHLKAVHGGYNCNACPMKFPTEMSFKKHVESTHIKVRFSCSQCKKVFVTRSYAERHCRLVDHKSEGIIKFKLKDGKPKKKQQVKKD